MGFPVNVGSAVTLIGGALGILSLLVGAFLLYKSAQVDTQRSAAAAWRSESEAQKSRADRLEELVTELTRRVEALEAENGTLRTLISNTKEIASLRTEMQNGLGKIESNFTQVSMLLAALQTGGHQSRGDYRGQ